MLGNTPSQTITPRRPQATGKNFYRPPQAICRGWVNHSTYSGQRGVAVGTLPGAPLLVIPAQAGIQMAPQRREGSITQQTALSEISPSARRGTWPGSPPTRGRRGRGLSPGSEAPRHEPSPRVRPSGVRAHANCCISPRHFHQHATRRTPPRHSRAGGNPDGTTA